MTTPYELLKGLLEYIEEQAKDINPKGFRISGNSGFVKHYSDLAGLPGIDFDLRPEGDHIWLRIDRLEANPQPTVPEQFKTIFNNISNDPYTQPPTLAQYSEYLTILHKAETTSEIPINLDQEDWVDQKPDDLGPEEDQEAKANQDDLNQEKIAFQDYLDTWNAWADLERPRRKSISLYGDLFALKHQIEAEETAKPQEFIWGIGVTTW